MAEKTDARIERLEKKSQESRAQMTEMMELIRTLIRDKGPALGPNPQNETAQPDQRREDVAYPSGTLPHMFLTSIWRKPHRCNKREGSRMAMRLPRRG